MTSFLRTSFVVLAVSAATLLSSAFWTGAQAEDPARPVVVELYTSQGCSSCPPADELLGELVHHSNVLALSFNVDYWDYIGWKDTLASPLHTERQRAYSRALSLRYVYTPQIVVDGSMDVVGSRKSEVNRTIELAAERQGPITVPISVDEGDGETGRITVGDGHAPDEGATVWLAVYDDEVIVNVGRGENTGRKLAYYNAVRQLVKLGTWNGQSVSFDLDLGAARRDGRSGCAVIVQRGDAGPVLGAYDMRIVNSEG